MPSLNVMSFIEECLDSVLNQTLDDIEIICIDAGSTDGTLEYLREAAASHERVSLIVSDKKSYGYQMNLGLDAATGEYIGIVETDDWIEPHMFERLYTTACAQKADVVKANYYWYYTKPHREDKPFENLAKCTYDTIFNPQEETTLFTRTPAIWSGIYRTEMLRESGIRFNETPGASYQDTSFHFMVCASAQRAYLLRDYLHHYRCDNEASSVNSPGKVYALCDEMHYFEAFLDERPELKESLFPFYLSLKYEKYRWNYARLSPQLQAEFLKVFHEEFAQHRDASLLQRRFFNSNVWRMVNLVATNPMGYYRETCKKYALRPQGNRLPATEVLVESATVSPDVSVIIPAFNCEAYIEAAVSSVMHQSHRNLEIICVDDGSTDSTLELLLSVAQSDERICILHHVNEGPAAAKNHALARARGAYVMFLDADDTLQTDAVEHLLQVAHTYDADALLYDGTATYETPQLRERYPLYQDCYTYDLPTEPPVDGLTYFCRAMSAHKYHANACMTFIKRALLDKHQIRFIEGIYHESQPFTFEVLARAQRVSHVPEQLYLKTVHERSLTTGGKSILHLYGLLASVARIQALCPALPYGDETNAQVASLLHELFSQVDSTYRAIKNHKDILDKLTDVERCQLDLILAPFENERINKQLADAAQREQDIVGSVSFRVGRKLTAPARTLRDAAATTKAQGFPHVLTRVTKHESAAEPVRPKALFVSSDAYRMSGAFLSQLELNTLLNKSFGEPTHIVLPYNGSGVQLAKQAGLSSNVIPSKDWIVPVGTPHDEEHELQKQLEDLTNRRAAITVARYALDHDFTLIHSNTSYTYVGALAAKLTGLPHVWHLREYLEEDQNNQFYDKDQAHQLLASSARVVAISKSLGAKYAPVIGDDKLRVIYNGIDSHRFYREDHTILTGERPILLFASGSNSPLKGRFDLIDACVLLRERGIDFELWFVGWCGSELQNYVRDRSLTDRTKFFGYQKDTEKFYAKADLFFMASRFEAFGRTTVEAGMAGCLLIGTNAACTPEIITMGETGYLYDFGDTSTLADIVEEALVHPEQSRAIAQAGQTHLMEHFTAHANAQAIHNLHVEVSQEYGALTAAQKREAYKRIEEEERRCTELESMKADLEERLARLTSQSKAGVQVQTGSDASAVDTTVADSDTPKVSVIIPIYNVEEYLQQCLKSVVSQTLSDIEILCVNDGSTDSSPAIARSFARQDPRVVVIDKDNGGYGAAVNRGIQQARGRYLAIVEPDDFIAPTMYEDLFGIAAAHNFVDIVKGSYWQYYDTEDGEGRLVKAPITTACKPFREVFDVWDYPEIIYHHPSIWSCLYRRDFIIKESISFVEAPGAGWVDNPFLLETFCRARSICWTPEAYYYYRQTNPNASSHIKDCSLPFRRTAEMLAFLKSEGVFDEAILRSVYKRILYNADATLQNPNYKPEVDNALIIDQIKRVDPRFVKEGRVKASERKAYRHFMSLR